MRLSTSIVRTLTTARGPIAIVLVWLFGVFSATPASGAPATGKFRGCHQRPSLARLIAAKRPVIILSEAARAGLIDTGAVHLRTARASSDTDEAVIQDDAPAAHLDLGDRAVPLLEPLGTLNGLGTAVPSHRMLARRSPRGPPDFRLTLSW